MSQLRKLEREFKDGALPKQAYIRKMYDSHKSFWDYLEFIQDKNIASIQITREEVLVTTKNNVTMICNPGDERVMPVDILNFGDYEPEETNLMRQFLEKDSVVVDIGANVGWHSIMLSREVPQGKVLAFEPIPLIFEYLKKNLALNNAGNVETYNYGFSDEQERLRFYFDPKLSAGTSARDMDQERQNVLIEAEVKRMDDTIAHLTPKIDFIKCDVEGAELLVLKGAIETIKKNRPALFLEMLRKWSAKYNYHPNDIIALMAGLGYECFSINNQRLAAFDQMTEESEERNFFFLDPRKHGRFIEKLASMKPGALALGRN
ncbi:MAG: FkbM family methyltransferase [Elusimicrobia bacterium]|nr:FkbM family methyltransferase [Elusimicrobiota bacterium]